MSLRATKVKMEMTNQRRMQEVELEERGWLLSEGLLEVDLVRLSNRQFREVQRDLFFGFWFLGRKGYNRRFMIIDTLSCTAYNDARLPLVRIFKKKLLGNFNS